MGLARQATLSVGEQKGRPWRKGKGNSQVMSSSSRESEVSDEVSSESESKSDEVSS